MSSWRNKKKVVFSYGKCPKILCTKVSDKMMSDLVQHGLPFHSIFLESNA